MGLAWWEKLVTRAAEIGLHGILKNGLADYMRKSLQADQLM